ncbi:MAG: TetR/AcrR family transcriptional regulator [Rhizobiaceae bacterium]|nr:TetR/AcrR family transcriptional regulator [Rhizobiaceae bacterium]
MQVSRQQNAEQAEKGPSARTRRLMLETATRLMQEGRTPSVSEVAEAAEVSRATAYRYFPSQAALVHAVVDEALGPILDWRAGSEDTESRVQDLIASSMPRIVEFEATFRAALKLSLEPEAADGSAATEPRFTRGHRVDLLRDAVQPLAGKLPPAETERLAQALSLIYGVEMLVVLKDIWGLGDKEAVSVIEWAARALVRTAISEEARE